MNSTARRYRRHLARELDNAAVYRELARKAGGERREILLGLADAETRHARHWAEAIERLGQPRPRLRGRRARPRARVLTWAARRLGTGAIAPLLERGEATELTRYDSEPGATEAMAVDERVHARVVGGLFPAWRTKTSGSLRAAVFGANDGLVSNLALVMGVAGGQADGALILLAGLAGLLGGALSMGVGEWISVTSQRELFAGEVELDADELDRLPNEGANELALLLRTRGLGRDEAEFRARELLADRDAAAHLLAREKLGFDPQALASPWQAALANFTAFAAGASVPVVPFALADGSVALLGAVAAAGVALFAVGAAISVLTNRPPWRVGARQLLIGALAASVTYLFGTLLGGLVG